MNEQEVFSFLTQNPDFFDRYPEFYHQLKLKYSSTKTTSLLEKRLNTLIEENTRFKKQAEEHKWVAAQNVESSNKVLHFYSTILNCEELSYCLTTILQSFRNVFMLELAELYCSNKITDCVFSFEDKPALLRFLAPDKITYGTTQHLSLNESFPDNVQSVALINIVVNSEPVILVLGSTDPSHFSPDKDLFFIEQIQHVMNLKLKNIYAQR